MSAKQLAAMALAAAALTAAGCGGSKKAATTGTTAATNQSAQSTSAVQTTPEPAGEPIKVSKGTPLSRTAWIRRGDAICARANGRLSTTTAKTAQDFARLLPQAAGYEREEATDLAKLTPPQSTATDWQQLVTEVQKFSEDSLAVARYAQANKLQEGLPIAEKGNKAQGEIVAIAKHLGFKVCSQP